MASDNSSDDGRGTASAQTEAAATEQQHSAIGTTLCRIRARTVRGPGINNALSEDHALRNSR